MKHHVKEAEQYLVGLPEDKANCIRVLLDWCDRFDLQTDGRHFWEFYFDDGAYNGGWTIKLRQRDITPQRVLGIANQIGWNGLKIFSSKVDQAILGVISAELNTRAKEQQGGE